jgi:hypothetical protein
VVTAWSPAPVLAPVLHERLQIVDPDRAIHEVVDEQPSRPASTRPLRRAAMSKRFPSGCRGDRDFTTSSRRDEHIAARIVPDRAGFQVLSRSMRVRRRAA